ncbi:phosphomevalonate kinase, peroxisomal-like [Camellia sinensis]|uniref:phosphomevalonate kinase, peroxisomal-like n=1 Tax=Camellia sinensis TaxID=4442 RepID=UPI001035EA58|nr:phosphomevalonate kinase, peroxisomal-like [Camellia sinensis]XP_028077137.1 phosphomevalonate kinase, peroxisomal-like [Camellia sinensis]XP_028103264.1 phosphomevalonate kinase, peroxisomal-like [Camellia sinensis]
MLAYNLCESRNPFVEYAVQYAVAAALATLEKDKKDLLHKLLLQGLDITILGCNDFYSYWNQVFNASRWGLSCEIGKGKVGSGFDVSSAVYGSQRYVHFSPEVLSSAQVSLSLPLSFSLYICNYILSS